MLVYNTNNRGVFNLMKKRLSLAFIGVIIISLFVACGNTDENNANNESASDENDINYSEAVDYTIIGIEPGAGISVTTEKAIEEYDELQGWEVELSSTAAMMSELSQKIDNEEPIVFTGWNPHWMFAQYPDLKYLDDPKEIYGGEESIHSLARLGFDDDHPEAYKLIEQFEWEVEDMEAIMYEAEETGDEVEDVAKRWVAENEDKTSSWTEGVDDVDGEKIEIVSTPWDSERASSGVLKEVMEQKGFDVTVTPVDVAIVFESVANGNADATVAAWLPITHIEFYEQYKDDMIDLGPNLVGAKIGLTVPEYMDIDSIEDLQPKQ